MAGIEIATGELMVNSLSNSSDKMMLELYQYKIFLNLWSENYFIHQRFGQAFYNYFSLHKITEQDKLCNLYEKDGSEALTLIDQLFEFI